MRLEVLTDAAALRALEPQWQELYDACPARDFFFSPQWLLAWWEDFGPGQHLFFFAVHSDDQLVGVLPLKMGPGKLRVLTLMGLPHADRVDFLLRPGFESQVLEAVARWLATHRQWDMLFLRACGVFSNYPELLATAFGHAGLTARTSEDSVYPYIRLHDYTDLEAFLATRSSERRRSFRRGFRNLANADEEMQFFKRDYVTDADFDQMADINCRRSLKSERGECFFSEPKRVAFLRRMAANAETKGALRFYGYAEGQNLYAYVLSFVFANKAYPYVTSFDRNYARYGLGANMLLLAIGDCIAQGMEEFDFLEGAESYKYHYTNLVRRARRLVVCNTTMRGRGLFLAMHVIKPWVQRLEAQSAGKYSWLARLKMLYQRLIH